jgi:transcriptional regulator with XRE-family HTH domain
LSKQKTLGAYLAALRKDKGQSLQDAANGIGTSKSQLWHMERNSPDIQLSTALKLCRHYGVTMNDIGACSLGVKG